MMRKNKFGVKIYKEDAFEKMKKVASLASKTLDYLETILEPNITTQYIDDMCVDFVSKNGGTLTCKGYQGFPKSLCTSINEVACHGIPGKTKLKEGDIVNLDVVVEIDGWHGDTSRTYSIGKVSEKHRNLIQIAKDAMYVGIESVKVNGTFNDIGKAVSKYVSKQNGFGLIRDFCGHGIGNKMHEEPLVLHFEINDETSIIEPGMFFTIEPIISSGSVNVKQLRDGWTMVTKDGSYAAQFEHTIAIGYDNKVHILT